MKPLISIIVPFQNHKEYVEKCWANIKLQTYENIEVIFVDNGSSDGSDKIVESLIKEFPDKINLVRENKAGIPFARNKGLTLANGEYVSFLDIDDLLTPDKLSTLHDSMLQSPGAAMAYGKTLRIYSGSGRNVVQDPGVAQHGINFPPTLAMDWINSFYHLPQTGSTLIKASIAKQTGGFPENLLLGNDDVGFHIKIALEYPVVFVPFTAVHYFRHEKSEGARLNDEKSVHFRYLDAHIKFTNPTAKKYFETKGDIRLWGFAQRAQFLNYLKCLNVPLPEMEWFGFYNCMKIIFKLLPFKIAMLIYKITRRPFHLFAPKKYPLH